MVIPLYDLPCYGDHFYENDRKFHMLCRILESICNAIENVD